MRALLGLVAVCALAGASCSDSDNPSGPSGGSCRTYLTTGTQLIGTASTNVTCSFSTQASTLTCVFVSPAGQTCQTQISSYRSTDDFVDEVQTIPPRNLRAVEATVNNGSCGAPSQTTTYTFDSDRRLLTARDGNTGLVTTYTNWDASGRPTAGTNPGPPFTTHSYVYTASTRQTVITTAAGGATVSTTLEYDASGNQTRATVTNGTAQTTTSTTIQTTQSVCHSS